MDYQALYRKYRPQRFSEVIGQDHVTTTLAREIVDGKVAHAYLFAGPRGTGKTTTARLLAKSLNCPERGPDGEPCNECASCVAVTAGTSLDVIELDAASHNKVEDVREIRANVGTVAVAGGAHKIYILDEAHMLSRAAGNALLKTLEEPPEHVIFVLATTEPYKLLDTIRSRAQHFDFLPVPTEVLVDYLGDIGGREGFTATADGLAMVASHAKGSVRDAMSLLEQVAALGGGKVEAEIVARALGLADRDAFSRLAVAIAENDAPAALGLVAELSARGGDLRRFVAEAMGFFRGVFLAHYAPNLEEIADEPADTLEEWKRHTAILPAREVLRAIDQLSEALMQLRQGREERLVTELAFIRLTRPETSVDVPSLISRIDRLEQRSRAAGGPQPVAAPVQSSTPGPVEPRPAMPQSQPTPQAKPAPRPEVIEAPPVAVPPSAADPAVPVPDLDLATFASAWPAISARLRDVAGPSKHALLKEAIPCELVAGTVVFEIPAHLPFHLEQLRTDPTLHAQIAQVAVEMLGGSVNVDFRSGSDDSPGSSDESEPERAPDKADLEEDAGGPLDPTVLVADVLGGEVVKD